MKITLSLKKSVNENASDYFDKAKKLKKKLEGANKALTLSKEKLKNKEKEAAPEKPAAPGEVPVNAPAPVEERIIFKHAVGTDVFVEKLVYEQVLMDVAGVEKDLQLAGNHLDKVFRNEVAVTKKVDDWNKALNLIQEKLMAIDVRLFDKGGDSL